MTPIQDSKITERVSAWPKYPVYVLVELFFSFCVPFYSRLSFFALDPRFKNLKLSSTYRYMPDSLNPAIRLLVFARREPRLVLGAHAR